MRLVCRPTFPLGMLIAFPAFVYTQAVAPSSAKLGRALSVVELATDRKLPGARPGEPEALRRRAEAALSKAGDLRQKQTEKDLSAAIALLHESISLFKALRSRTRAAAASLQIGDIYATLSRYDEALSS